MATGELTRPGEVLEREPMASEHLHPDLLDEQLEDDQVKLVNRLSASCTGADVEWCPHCDVCRRPYVRHEARSGALWWHCVRCGHYLRAE